MDELAQLAERARVLDAGRAAADHDEREISEPLLVVGGLGRVLEAGEHVVAQALGLGERLHPERRLGQRRIAEEVARAPGREDEVVVRKLAARTRPEQLPPSRSTSATVAWWKRTLSARRSTERNG